MGTSVINLITTIIGTDIPSSQLLAVPGKHMPFKHRSFMVHHLPSSQKVPVQGSGNAKPNTEEGNRTRNRPKNTKNNSGFKVILVTIFLKYLMDVFIIVIAINSNLITKFIVQNPYRIF